MMHSNILKGLIMPPHNISEIQHITNCIHYINQRSRLQLKKILSEYFNNGFMGDAYRRWNSIANSVAGRLANLKPVNTDLNDYLTNKALSGMFLKVEAEELKIRKDVSARVTPLLQKVFGSLDNKPLN